MDGSSEKGDIMHQIYSLWVYTFTYFNVCPLGASERGGKVKTRRRGRAETMSHNCKHLIDSHDLFCCIAAVVPLWLLSLGRRERKIRAPFYNLD